MATVLQLRKRCKELKLKGYTKLKKIELEKLLEKHRKAKLQNPEAEKPKAEKPKHEKPKAEKPKHQKPKHEKPKAEKPKQVKNKNKDDTAFGLQSTKYRWIENTYKMNGFTCIKLFNNTFLYRGNKKKTELKHYETYFAPWYGTTNNYIPKRAEGYMEIYELYNKNLKLFDLSNLENINKLLRDTFHNKV